MKPFTAHAQKAQTLFLYLFLNTAVVMLAGLLTLEHSI